MSELISFAIFYIAKVEVFIYLFQQKGIQRVAVGIGRKIEQEELETIAGSPDRVVNAASFDELDKQLDDIRETTCSEFLFIGLML